MIKHTFHNFIMPLTNIVLKMGLRGVRVDTAQLGEFQAEFEKEALGHIQKYRQLVGPMFGIDNKFKEFAGTPKELTALHKKAISWLNPNSAMAQKELLYDILKLNPQRQRKTKQLTVNEEAVRKLLKLKKVKDNPNVCKLLKVILDIREVGKKISTYCLEAE